MRRLLVGLTLIAGLVAVALALLHAGRALSGFEVGAWTSAVPDVGPADVPGAYQRAAALGLLILAPMLGAISAALSRRRRMGWWSVATGGCAALAVWLTPALGASPMHTAPPRLQVLMVALPALTAVVAALGVWRSTPAPDR